MQIIGLGHYSRTGKDTFANMVVEAASELDPFYVVKKVPFAWKLKQIAYELYSWSGLKPPEHYDTKEGEPDRDVVLEPLGMTPVELWVKLGTPAIRQQVYDRTWIDYVLKNEHGADAIIIPDVRFENEAASIHAAGGVLIKLVRKGVKPRRTVADLNLLAFDGWDYVLGGSLTDLNIRADQFADWLMGGDKPVQTEKERNKFLQEELYGSFTIYPPSREHACSG